MSMRTKIYRSTADIAGALAVADSVAIREISGLNTSLDDIYLQIFDMNSVPDEGSTEMKFTPIKVAAGDRFDVQFTIDLYPYGMVFDNGVYICASSTKYTKTIVVAPAIDLQVIYEDNR